MTKQEHTTEGENKKRLQKINSPVKQKDERI